MLCCFSFKSGVIHFCAVICYYLSNEGVSLLENAAHIGLPVPDGLKTVLSQLHKRSDTNSEEESE